MKPATESTLMGLPLEVRAKILGYLLPNLAEIKVFDGYYDGFNAVNRNWYAETMEDANVEDDRNITQRVASTVQFRDDGAQCHTAILRVSRQLYIDGTAIMYNRAFRAVITARGITFLKFRFPSARERCNTEIILEPGDLQYFPFHLAKQIQIEIWATLFGADQDVYLYSALLDLCLILSDKPSLRNVRVSLYDRNYRPKPEPKSQDRKADDSGPYPPQDGFPGDVLHEPFQRTAEEIEFWGDVRDRDFYDRSAEPWEQVAVVCQGCGGPRHIYWRLPSDNGPRGLEAALEPLKLLANVGRARINLTPKMKKHQDMLADATKLQNSMMLKGLRHEIDMICTRCKLRPVSEVHTCQVPSMSYELLQSLKRFLVLLPCIRR